MNRELITGVMSTNAGHKMQGLRQGKYQRGQGIKVSPRPHPARGW